MKLNYDIMDKPSGIALFSLAVQQMLTILAATIAVPMIVGNGLTPAATMFGAGAGTLVYIFFTKRKSPVFLGSSFSFLGSALAAFAGGVSMQLGMLGLLIGAFAAGMVYVILAAIVRKVGTGWVDTLMPPVVIGPTVSVIGLSLAGNAISDLQTGSTAELTEKGAAVTQYAAVFCGLVTLTASVLCAVYGNKMIKLIPFLIGILSGYAAALLLTFIGMATGSDALILIDLNAFRQGLMPDGAFSVRTLFSLPPFVFAEAFHGIHELSAEYFLTVVVAYVPVSFVAFAEHIADHKNLSSVIDRDLLTEPGLERTLLGDGLGSIVGAFFGGCPNTTYGESIACVALTGNASVITIIAASAGCILLSFVTPFVVFISTVPNCVMGGLCMLLYGFIALSGFKMIQHIDLDDNRNIFIISVILTAGIGGFCLHFGAVTVSQVASAMLIGIFVNLLVPAKKK